MNSRDYSGDFEVHITVRTASATILDRFRDWCGARGFRCLRIVLARGAHVEQPMATWRRWVTTLSAVTTEAEKCAVEISQAGIQVLRVKIEAALDNEQVPLQDIDAATHEPSNYFEHHVKLRQATLTPRAALLQVCEKHSSHLSRNTFRETEEGLKVRFVTRRSYGVGRITAEEQRRQLLAALAELGEQVVESESEYCVYDSNLNLDAGWLRPLA